jgi:lysophospholipase L1-like esterase
VIGYEYRPDYKPTDEPFSWSHKGYAINSAGFRDYEYEEAKPEGTYRIVVLGDSTTAGNGVQDVDKTYTKILEKLQNRDSSIGMHYEVLNLGVGGYHTMQEVETLRVKGLKYRPDLVLLTFCVNDFNLHGDGGVYERLRKLNQISVRDANSSLYKGVLRFSRLAFVVHHRLNSSRTKRDQWYSESVLKGQSAVKAGLALLSELQQRHGFLALVVILPEFRAPFDQYKSSATHKRVFQAAEGLPGITVIDLLERFASLDVDAEKFSYDGWHMNEYGHQTMAEILLPIIRTTAKATQHPESVGVRPALSQ